MPLERRGSLIYDPARDIFTKWDEQQPENQNAIESPESLSITNKRARSSDSPTAGRVASPAPQANASKNGRLDTDTEAGDPPAKKLKVSPDPSSKGNDSPRPMTAASLSQIPRSKKASEPSKEQPRRRDRSPPNKHRSVSPGREPDRRRREFRRTDRRDRRRTPPPRRSRSPKPISRTPSPPPRSPPRQRKRPGGFARVSLADKEAVRQRQLEREQEQTKQAQAEGAARGVHDVVRQHYNAVPQRGREWRKTDSKIRGLRSFNNWVKSAIIQKFSPEEDYKPEPDQRRLGYDEQKGLLVMDIGCGKGGDLQKWQAAPQKVDLYVGVDPAEISIDQARERYEQMCRGGRGRKPNFQAEFIVKDAYGEWIGTVPIIQEVGIDESVGPSGTGSQRWGGGGFDVVTMMFCMHYAYESEAKARGMLKNVAGCLKKGGRFLGVIPNSDILTAKVKEYHLRNGSAAADNEDDADDWDPEKPSGADKKDDGTANGTQATEEPTDGTQESPEWGNSIYRVKFPSHPLPPTDGIFRPPYGWKYFYFLEEAVEEIPEYVVPWEAFRAIAEDYNLELQYRKPFNEVWEEERDDPVLGPLSERMGVRDRDGGLRVSEEEMDAAGFYHAFCFYKV